MTMLVCTIAVIVNMGGINAESTADVEGTLLHASDTKYVVDFREGLKKYPKVVHPENYDKKIVNKSDCVTE
jgi:hypothetical protein